MSSVTSKFQNWGSRGPKRRSNKTKPESQAGLKLTMV